MDDMTKKELIEAIRFTKKELRRAAKEIDAALVEELNEQLWQFENEYYSRGAGE